MSNVTPHCIDSLDFELESAQELAMCIQTQVALGHYGRYLPPDTCPCLHESWAMLLFYWMVLS
jgi:hypothetical protein